MKLSIIIPFQKGELYLLDCLKSIVAQQLEQYEVLLIGDHAEIDMESFLGQFQLELPVFYVELQEETGVAAARNLGLNHAKGDYVYFLDSDDYLMEGALNLLQERARQGAQLVQGKMEKTWYGRNSFLKNDSDKEQESDTEALDQQIAGIAVPEAVSGSVLHLLIQRSLIGALRFDESLTYFSDLPFVTALLQENSRVCFCTEARYIKRNHNDSIRHPSLTQIKDEKKPEEFLKSWKQAAEVVSQSRRRGLTAYLCNYMIRQFCKGKHPEGYSWKIEVVKSYANVLSTEDKSVFSQYSSEEQKLLLAFWNGNVKKAERKARSIVFRRKKKGLFGSKMQWIWAINKMIFRKLPVKQNWVLFESFLGKSYADSCKYIYEYMNQNLPDQYRYIWVLQNKDEELAKNAKCIKPLSLKYFYYTARSKYWVNNMRQPLWFEKRPGMVFLETWHGTPLKKLVFDMEEVHSASPEYKAHFYKQSRMWDYLVSDNPFSTEVFERAFLFPREKILEYGYPRNDLLYSPDKEERIRKIRLELNIPEGKKIVLYAPTWRDDEYYGPGQYKFKLPLDLGLLRSELEQEYIILLRTHYFIADRLDVKEEEKSFVFDVSRYSDIGELYLISDICITDYSSVFFDYANLNRPILFYVYDFEKYRDVLRGFYIDMETELPGPLLYTSEEVVEAIQKIHLITDEYADRYKKFHDRFCNIDDGHAAKRIVQKVFIEGRET